jgi:hypothetical protein
MTGTSSPHGHIRLRLGLFLMLNGYPLHPSTSGWGPTIVSIGCRTDSNRLLGEAMKAQSPSVCAGNLSLGPGVSHVPSTNVTRLLNLGQRDTHLMLLKGG